MSNIVQLPVVQRLNFGDDAWIEQRAREATARAVASFDPPPRTRPILVPVPAPPHDELESRVRWLARLCQCFGVNRRDA